MVPYFGWCYIFWDCSTLWVNPCISWSTSDCHTYPTSYYPSSTYGVCLTWDHYNYPFRRPSHFMTYSDMSLSSTTQYCACPDTYSWWWRSKFPAATFPDSIIDLSIAIQKGIHPTQNHSPFHIKLCYHCLSPVHYTCMSSVSIQKKISRQMPYSTLSGGKQSLMGCMISKAAVPRNWFVYPPRSL